jgi:hypothetical protein
MGGNDIQIYVVFNRKLNKMKEDKNLEQNLDKSNEKLHISDVMNSILLSKFEIYLINTLRFDINDILIARQQRKEFAIEWSNKYCS